MSRLQHALHFVRRRSGGFHLRALERHVDLRRVDGDLFVDHAGHDGAGFRATELQRTLVGLVAGVGGGCHELSFLEVHATDEARVLEAAHAGLQRGVERFGTGGAARPLARFEEADAAVEMGAGQTTPGDAFRIQVRRLNGSAGRSGLGGNRQLHVLARGERDRRGTIRREPDVERAGRNLTSRFSGIAGDLHQSRPHDEGVLQGLPVGAVFQVHRAARERLEPARRGARHRDARVVSKIQRVDPLAIFRQVGGRIAGLDRLATADDPDAVVEPGVPVAARELHRGGRDLRCAGPVAVGGDAQDRMLKNIEDVAVFVVGHPEAAALRAAAGELHRARRSDKAVPAVVRGVLGPDSQSIRGDHLNVAVERQHRLLLANMALVAGDGEGARPAALVGLDLDREQLHRAIRVQQLSSKVDADVLAGKRDALEPPVGHLGDCRGIGACGRQVWRHRHPRPELPGHDRRKRQRQNRDQQTDTPPPESHVSILGVSD